MIKNTENLESLPTLPNLMKDPVVLVCTASSHRQLRAAGLLDKIKLRLRLITLDAEGDGAEWDSYRKTVGNGQVVCPECENSGGDPEECPLCEGKGVVGRALWDQWYFDVKGCKDYKPGCEVKCKLRHCVRDTAHAISYDSVLVLEASATTPARWKEHGNSIDGFKTEGVCGNPAALDRYLDIIVASLGVASVDGFDDED